VIRKILLKDLSLGPRSPILLWALVLPIVLTLLIRMVFGSLFASEPRLGIVDLGNSAVVATAGQLEGIQVTFPDTPEELRQQVEAGNLDAGLVLQAGFDELVRSGAQPELQFWVGGESLASDRIILGVTAIDLVRTTSGVGSPVDVTVVPIGDQGLELTVRMLPMLVIMAVAIAGVMVPAASLIEEKTRRTLSAVLVTPARLRDVLVAKGLLGAILAVLTGVMTLLLNNAFGDAPLATLLAVAVGAVMMAEIGLILGSWAPDTNTMFAAWKGGAILLLFPVLFTIWPSLPQWIAKLGPTYYFLQPIFDLSINGATFADVAPQLAIAAAICIALLPVVLRFGRSLEARLVGGPKPAKPTPVSV